MDNKSGGAGRTMIVDAHGRSAVFFGSDSWNGVGGNGIVTMSGRSIDFEPSQFGVSKARQPDYFHVIPEVDPLAEISAIGVIIVQLVEQEDDEFFVITAKQLKAFAGQPLPYRVKRVYKLNTTESFSVIW
jgi:hypothetical protein